jgi:hypothetical protein
MSLHRNNVAAQQLAHCAHCGRAFVATKSWQRFCRPACRVDGFRAAPAGACNASDVHPAKTEQKTAVAPVYAPRSGKKTAVEAALWRSIVALEVFPGGSEGWHTITSVDSVALPSAHASDRQQPGMLPPPGAPMGAARRIPTSSPSPRAVSCLRALSSGPKRTSLHTGRLPRAARSIAREKRRLGEEAA